MAYKKYPRFYKGGFSKPNVRSKTKTMAMQWTKRPMKVLPFNQGITAEIKEFRGGYASESAANGSDGVQMCLLNKYTAAGAVDNAENGSGGISQGFDDAKRIGKSIDIVEIGAFVMVRDRVPRASPSCPTTLRTPRRFCIAVDEASNGAHQPASNVIVQSLSGARNPNTRSRFRVLTSQLVVPYVDSVPRSPGDPVADDMLHASCTQFSYRKRFKKPIRTTYLNNGYDHGSLGTNVPWIYAMAHEKVNTHHYQTEAHWYVRYKDA